MAGMTNYIIASNVKNATKKEKSFELAQWLDKIVGI